MQTQYNDPKGQAGSLKAPLGLVPPHAMEQTAWVHKLGADKYGPWNWRETGVCASTYVNAILRHLNAWRDGEDLDPESGITHLAHIACSANILMDAEYCGKLQDDRNKRPTNGEDEEDSSIEGILQEWLESAREDMEDFGFELAEDTVPEYHVLLREGDKLQDGDEVYVGEDHWLPVYVSDWMTPSIVRNGTYRRKITNCDLKDKVAICDLKEEPSIKYRVETTVYRKLNEGEIIQEDDEFRDFDRWFYFGEHCCGKPLSKDVVARRKVITDCDLKEEPQDMGECTCGRLLIYHWLYGWICEDCELKHHDSYYP